MSFAEIREQEKHLASGQGALAEIQTPLLIAGQPSATDFSSHLSPFTCNKNWMQEWMQRVWPHKEYVKNRSPLGES